MSQLLKITPDEARSFLSQQDLPSVGIFDKKIEVRYFIPSLLHEQKTHTRDELYIIIAGHSDFRRTGEQIHCLPGDLLFVPAEARHEFFNWSDDFAVWVIFFN